MKNKSQLFYSYPTGLILNHLTQARDYTLSMPYRIQQIEEFVRQLESGDVKLRVRVLEVCSFQRILIFTEFIMRLLGDYELRWYIMRQIMQYIRAIYHVVYHAFIRI